MRQVLDTAEEAARRYGVAVAVAVPILPRLLDLSPHKHLYFGWRIFGAPRRWGALIASSSDCTLVPRLLMRYFHVATMASGLNVLNFDPAGGDSAPGLVPVRGKRPRLSIDEEAAMREAEAIGDINFVFFRRLSDNRSSQVAAYVIDNCDDQISEQQLAELHRRVWLHGVAPLLYVGWHTRVDVLSCARGPDFWKNGSHRYNPAEQIQTAAKVSDAIAEKQRCFSAFRLSDGTFWEDPENFKLARAEAAAHRRLIEAVVDTDRELGGQRNPVLRRLLLLTVLIKYLEDREVFPLGWFDQFHSGAKCFLEVLQNGTPDEVRDLLGRLERKFNGDVFSLPETAQDRLTPEALRAFAGLIEAKTINEQRYLWEQFSFKYIPVEVLSHLYQRFAQRGKGAVFTPPFVAALILDFALPYQRITGNERVLDPTCGSGVFLVGAFRRLVQFWRSENDWRQPGVATLKRILNQQIFGVELQEDAVQLTAFSLALAVCDALQPNVIWRELRLDKLVGANLLVGDFFEHLPRLTPGPNADGFAAVIGNPPFLSKFSDAAQTVNKANGGRVAIPDQQMAYLIAEQAVKLLKPKGRMCLIQPSGFLYNEKTGPFQRQFLASQQVDAILDFTSIRGLYDGADPKTVALLATREPPAPSHHIRHLTFRRTFAVRERISFDLDHYDRHAVPQWMAETCSWVWRANLLGGGRLLHLAQRMASMPNLGQFVANKRWDYGEGYIAATTGRREAAPWLTGKPLLPTRAFTERGIDESKITVVETTRFRSAYTAARYSAPIVLIKEHESLPCAFREEGFLAYKHKIVGVHAEPEQERELHKFHQEFLENRNPLRAAGILLGSQALVGKSTAILKQDLDKLPWPEDGNWDFSAWEKILCNDLVSSMTEFVRRGQNSRLLKHRVTSADLKAYATVFVEMLGSVYENLRAAKSLLLDGVACQAFCFGDAPEVDWDDDWQTPLRKLIYLRHGDALRTIRVVRIYEGNVILVVKPDRLRYWLGSTAIRDADETLVDLRQQGY
jgi:hypothetical protein